MRFKLLFLALICFSLRIFAEKDFTCNIQGEMSMAILKAESDPKSVLGIDLLGTEEGYLTKITCKAIDLNGFETSDLAEIQNSINSGIAIYKDSNDPNGLDGAFDETDIFMPFYVGNWSADTDIEFVFENPELILYK